jgi:hypothetical protein
VADDEVQAKMLVFLGMFGAVPGSPDWQSKALSDALNSVVQHNPTYTPGTTASGRVLFRAAWRKELTGIGDEYIQSMKDRTAFESDILRLQAVMNAQFHQILQPVDPRYAHGFRVSHAQKSLSLLLKHCWCHGRIEEPPACPVDRVILTKARAPYDKRTWMTANTMEAYRDQIGYLDSAAAAAGQTVAVWELLQFK